ncbi:MAG: DNA translocase FtsK 4TM domain-containing protein, partial [Solirubrobacteraceae bacterium]
MSPARKRPPARSSSARRTPAKRSRARSRRTRSLALLPAGLPRLPVLDQRERDVLGLALVAFGVFMGFVLYGGWNGGRAGHGLAVALGWMLGRARVLTPAALVVGGGALLLRPVLPALRPLRTGAVCVFAAVTLALAAGMLGLSSGSPQHERAWSSAHLQSHGGVAGQALYELTHRLVQSVGVDILAVFLLLTGVILLTGASIASVIRATGSGLLDSTRIVRSLGERGGEQRQSSRARGVEAQVSIEPMRLPDPSPEELIVRATHVEAPPRDWREEDPVEPPVQSVAEDPEAADEDEQIA